MKRIEKICRMMKKDGFDAIVVTDWGHLFYLTGLRPVAAQLRLVYSMPLVISTKGETVFIPAFGFRHEHPGIEKIKPFSDDPFIHPRIGRWEQVKTTLEEWELESGKIGIQYANTSRSDMIEIKELLKQFQIKDCSSMLEEAFMVKSTEELAYIKKACEIAVDTVEAVMNDFLKPGKTEKLVAEELMRIILDNHAQPLFVQVLSGKRSAIIEGSPTKNLVERGDIVVIDLGVNYEGYCSDIARTAVVGRPSRKQSKIFQAVRDIVESTIGIVRPGVRACDIDNFARSKFKQLGYGKYYVHRTGHGIGSIAGHERPILAEFDQTEIRPSIVLAIEQGIYISSFGIRLEDDIVVTKSGNYRLTKCPQKLTIIS